MTEAIITVNKKLNLVSANTQNSAWQLYNEGVVSNDDIPSWPPQINEWYPINGSYGLWVLKNEFPNTKGGEVINVNYI